MTQCSLANRMQGHFQNVSEVKMDNASANVQSEISLEQHEEKDDTMQSGEQDAETYRDNAAEELESSEPTSSLQEANANVQSEISLEQHEEKDDTMQSGEQDAETYRDNAAEELESPEPTSSLQEANAFNVQSEISLEQHEEKDDTMQSGEQDAETYRDNAAEELGHTRPTSLQEAKVEKRPVFIPDTSEEVELETDFSSLPTLEGFEPIESDDG